jgi:hypothetical protein
MGLIPSLIARGYEGSGLWRGYFPSASLGAMSVRKGVTVMITK